MYYFSKSFTINRISISRFSVGPVQNLSSAKNITLWLNKNWDVTIKLYIMIRIGLPEDDEKWKAIRSNG